MKTLALLASLLLGFVAACGDEEPPPPRNVVRDPLAPRDALNAVRLAHEEFVSFEYCEKTWPAVCDQIGNQAYVLPREGTDDFRVVFFNNQWRDHGAREIYDYATVQMYGEAVTVVGHYEIQERPEGRVEAGEPHWGIPE